MTKSGKTQERPPIVVVMGHVDHGKSTLLDYIRKANTVAKEAGGITQRVAAYEVDRETVDPSTSLKVNKRITFIDTPGHAAFSAIRARGANVADIAILVVAADDGVKAQTLEALASIREAGIPFVVAINKVDKTNANVERTQASLMEQAVYLEKLGGDVPWAAVSAKTGAGVDELLDLILIVAELQELKADPSPPAEGYVIEAHRDPKRGLAATLIITSGTLKSGMAVLAGRAVSPVRIMENHAGTRLREAGFSSPVTLIGFDDLPAVGERFKAFKTKKDAEQARPELEARTNATEEEEGDHFYLPVIVRADAQGSLEAIAHELVQQGDEHASLRIVQSGVGSLSETDVKAALAGTVPAVLVGFNVGIDPIAEVYARERGVRVETFSIIYKLTEKLQQLLEATRPKRVVEEVFGRAKVLKLFSGRKGERTVGGRVEEGYLSRGASVRIMRRGAVVGLGNIGNIQSNKQNVERVDTGGEFGAQIESESDLAQGDVLECFTSSMK